MSKIRLSLGNMSVSSKMILAFFLPTLLLFFINLVLFVNMKSMTTSLDEVYESNNSLADMTETLNQVQGNVTLYLNTRNTDSLEEYYVQSQNYSDQVEKLQDSIADNDSILMERNIKKMSEEYLDLTNKTIEAKRGENVEKYKKLYEESENLYTYITTAIFSLNNEQFKNNSKSYSSMMSALQSLEAINMITMVVIGFTNLLFIALIAATITGPLVSLAATADKVGKGDFEVDLLPEIGMDEVGVVTATFNKMILSIRDYINRLTESMEAERRLQEKELLMETHLKDAQLKYLQAQINPHFLFNTLNAGVQLAMMEDAENTGMYIQRVADFFRYNIKKNHDVVSLGDEIELVETYIYILNVRFSGDIHFRKDIDERLLDAKVPSMILQPIVENSVNYGIRDIDWKKIITLKVYGLDNMVCISISDNGVGIPQDKIEAILSGQFHAQEDMVDSNGVGLDNVINRLRLFFGEDDIMDIISEGEDQGTETILYLPMQE